MIQSLIRQETSDQFLHLDLLRQMFGSRMVDKNQQIWSRLLRKWNADENELIMANLILHTTLIAASSTRKNGLLIKERPFRNLLKTDRLNFSTRSKSPLISKFQKKIRISWRLYAGSVTAATEFLLKRLITVKE